MTRADDRGRTVELLWPATPAAVAAEREHPELAEVWGDIRAQALHRRPWEVVGRRVGFAFLPVLVIGCGVGFVLTRDPEALFWAVVLTALSVFTVWKARRTGLMRPSELVAGMLAHGRCASCGYGIGVMPPEEDGCTVCPECSAAWRVPDGCRHGA